MAGRTVLAKTRIFTVNPGNHVNVIPLEIRPGFYWGTGL